MRPVVFMSSVSEALHERVLAELNYTKAEFTMLREAVC